MSREYFDNELFISEVETRPILWDNSNEGYRDKEKKMAAWDEICNILYCDYEELNDIEKNSTRRTLQLKWKNIKDCYNRDIRVERNKNTGKCRKRYVYYNALAFLHKTMDNSDTIETNMMWFETDNNSHELQTEIKNELLPVYLPEPESTLAQPTLRKRPTKTVKSDTEPISYTQDKNAQLKIEPISYTQDKNTEFSNEKEEMDEDKAFFISFLPIIKTFDVNQKLEFRTDMLNSIKKIKQRLAGSSSCITCGTIKQQTTHD